MAGPYPRRVSPERQDVDEHVRRVFERLSALGQLREEVIFSELCAFRFEPLFYHQREAPRPLTFEQVVSGWPTRRKSVLEVDGTKEAVLEGPDWQAYVKQQGNRQPVVTFAAESESALQRIMTEFWTVQPCRAKPDSIPIAFWQNDTVSRLHFTHVETIEVPGVQSWTEIRHNYTDSVHSKMAPLLDLTQFDPLGGRIVLLHGSTGTGKSTAVMALARHWHEQGHWIDMTSEPDDALGKNGIVQSLVRPKTFTDEYSGGRRTSESNWRVLILEDVGEVLKANLKAGGRKDGLGRLLQAGDSVLSRASRTVVVITTNVAKNQMDEALRRKGRCIAQIEFPKLARHEAAGLLGYEPSRPLSLAEVFALKRGEEIDRDDPTDGWYL